MCEWNIEMDVQTLTPTLINRDVIKWSAPTYEVIPVCDDEETECVNRSCDVHNIKSNAK